MSDKVWISDVSIDANKQGLRWKYPCEEWIPAKHELSVATQDELNRRVRRYSAGYRLAEGDVPEAAAIWEPKCFAGTGDMFIVGTMYAVKPRLAEVLSRFDLGEGKLTPLKMYDADLVTPAPGEYWLLQLGARKNSFLPESSNQEGHRISSMGVAKRSGPVFTEGVEYWQVTSLIQDGDVAVSPAALGGADLWVEERVSKRLFMSGALAQAISEANLKKVDFRLKQCCVVGG